MPIKALRNLKARYAPQGSFRSHVLTLMTGTTIAQAIPIAVSPILTRIYGPQDFGVYVLFMAIMGLISSVSTGCYEFAVVLPEKEEDAANTLWLSILISVVVSLVAIMAIFMFNRQITRLINNQEISLWLYFIPLSVFLTGVYQVFSYWCMRKKQFDRLATTRVLQSIATAAMNLGLGFGGLTSIGLIAGGIGGQSLAMGVIAWQTWQQDRQALSNVSISKIKEQFKRYKNFPRFVLFQSFFDMLRESGTTFVISRFYPGAVLGFYALSLRAVRTPLNLMGSSVSQVFYQTAAQSHNRGEELWPLVRKVMRKLVMVGLPIFIVIAIFGGDIFSILFGDKWRVAGSYAQILSLWLFINFISSPISKVPMVLGKQGSFLLICIGYNIIIPITIFLAASSGGAMRLALWSVSIMGSGCLVGIILWIAKISKRKGLIN